MNFFRECYREGAVPLSYRSHKEFVNGSRTVEYENPEYAKAKKGAAGILAPDMKENSRIDNLVSRLYGEEVVIHTSSGYHYGMLSRYDGRELMLENYHFDKRQIDIFDYLQKAFFSNDSAVPAENIISISKIPLKVR
jgi:hypothetical protein